MQTSINPYSFLQAILLSGFQQVFIMTWMKPRPRSADFGFGGVVLWVLEDINNTLPKGVQSIWYKIFMSILYILISSKSALQDKGRHEGFKKETRLQRLNIFLSYGFSENSLCIHIINFKNHNYFIKSKKNFFMKLVVKGGVKLQNPKKHSRKKRNWRLYVAHNVKWYIKYNNAAAKQYVQRSSVFKALLRNISLLFFASQWNSLKFP